MSNSNRNIQTKVFAIILNRHHRIFVFRFKLQMFYDTNLIHWNQDE